MSVTVRPMEWPGFQPTCHEYGCENDARWHVFFPYYEEYRCDAHKAGVESASRKARHRQGVPNAPAPVPHSTPQSIQQKGSGPWPSSRSTA